MADPTDDPTEAEEGLAELAAALTPVAPPGAARERLLAELRGRVRYAPFAAEIAEIFQVPLPAVQVALERVDDADAWLALQPPAPPVLPLHGTTLISRLPPGTRIPHHTHAGREVTYVLDGVLISDGVEHRRGQCVDMLPGTAHEVHIGGDHPCLVVIMLPIA